MGIGNRIKTIRGALSREVFGNKIGVSKTAIQNYELKDQVPKGEVLLSLRDEFKVNVEWLLTGEGETYLSEQTKDLGVRLEAITKAEAERRKAAAGESVESVPEAKIKVSEALTMAARVLESGTSYANALYLNIQHFDRAIQTEQRLSSFETELRKMRSEIENLKAVQTTLANIKEIYARHAAPDGVQEKREIMKDLDRILDIANAPENTNHTGLPETVLEDDRLKF